MRRTFLILMVSIVFLSGCGHDCFYGPNQPYNPNCPVYPQYQQPPFGQQFPQQFPQQLPQYPQYQQPYYPPVGYPQPMPPVYPCAPNNPYCYHEVQD